MPRILDELCDKCGKKKEMYYTPYCPRCDVPAPEPRLVLNYLKAARYITITYFPEDDDIPSLGPDSHDRCAWLWLGEYGVILGNDIVVSLDFPSLLDVLRDDSYQVDNLDEEENQKAYLFFEKLVEEFDLRNEKYADLLWEISW